MVEQQEMTEEDIDIRKYITVLMNRKIMIFTVTLFSILLAVIYNYGSQKIYEVKMIIDPPVVIDKDNLLQLTPFEEIQSKIEQGVYDYNILKTLHLYPKMTSLQLIPSRPKLLNSLKITLLISQDQKEIGIAILKQLVSEIENDFKNLIALKTDEIQRHKTVLTRSIDCKENEIISKNENLKILENRENGIENDLKEAEKNTRELMEKRKDLLTGNEKPNDSASILYITTIQQSIRYSNELRFQLSDLKINKVNIQTHIRKIKAEIENIRSEIQRTELLQSATRNIRYLQEPVVSETPVKPQKTKNLLVGCILGFLLSIFSVVTAESVKKK
jgi:LPS O-antigen subunit length determinant protein (WzzB/FepE family)